MGVGFALGVISAMTELTDKEIKEALELIIANKAKGDPSQKIVVVGSNHQIYFEKIVEIAKELDVEIKVLDNPNDSLIDPVRERNKEWWDTVAIQMCDIPEPCQDCYVEPVRPKKRKDRYKSPHWNF